MAVVLIACSARDRERVKEIPAPVRAIDDLSEPGEQRAARDPPRPGGLRVALDPDQQAPQPRSLASTLRSR